MKPKRALVALTLVLGLVLTLCPTRFSTGGAGAAEPRADVSERSASAAWSAIQAPPRPHTCCVHDDTPGLCSPTLAALPISQVAKLVASDGYTADHFGDAVAIAGDTVVVGARWDNVGFVHSAGSAYVFERSQGGANQWGEVTKLVAGDGADYDYFGISVAIAGDIIVSGAYSDDIGEHTSQGSAYIFKRNPDPGDPWLQGKKLTAGDGDYYDYFGRSVAIAGDTVVVGASGGEPRGAAYVFQRNQGGPGLWGQVRKLTADDAVVSGNHFGISVAIAGDTVVVGDDEGEVGGNADQGAAYVFERDQGGADQWGQVKKLTASDGAALGYFGGAVAIAGDTIVIGASGDGSEQGAAYVFERNQGGADQWGQVRKLTAADAASGDRFGSAVAIAGDRVVVGAESDEVGSNEGQGSAYVFERDQGGADQWGQVEKLTADDGAADDQFGCAAAMATGTIVLGAYADDVGGTSSQGSAYVFQSVANVYLPLVARQVP